MYALRFLSLWWFLFCCSSARFRWIRFQLLALLFRVGFANSMTPWLYTCFRQERPCYCQLSSDSEIYHFGYNLWGMPSGDCVVAAVMGCQIFEQMHWAPSLAIFLLIPVQRVVLGLSLVPQAPPPSPFRPVLQQS